MNNTILTPALRAELARHFPNTTKYAVMALHVFLTKEKPGPEPGFMEEGWISETLNRWRSAGFYSVADGIAETQLISKFPALAGLLTQIRAGAFDHADVPEQIAEPVAPTVAQPESAAPAIVAPPPPSPIQPPKENTMKCQRTTGCDKAPGHIGMCKGQNNFPKRAAATKEKEPETAPAAPKAVLMPKPKAEMVYANPLLKRAPVTLEEAGDVQENVRLAIVRQALEITSRALDLLA